MITGIDIVKEQLKIASGEKLSIKQSDIKIQGMRLNAELMPKIPKHFCLPGKISWYHAPGGPGIRIDSHIYSIVSSTPQTTIH